MLEAVAGSAATVACVSVCGDECALRRVERRLRRYAAIRVRVYVPERGGVRAWYVLAASSRESVRRVKIMLSQYQRFNGSLQAQCLPVACGSHMQMLLVSMLAAR